MLILTVFPVTNHEIKHPTLHLIKVKSLTLILTLQDVSALMNRQQVL